MNGAKINFDLFFAHDQLTLQFVCSKHFAHILNSLNAKIETSQLICRANQLIGLYIMTALVFNELKVDCDFILLFQSNAYKYISPAPSHWKRMKLMKYRRKDCNFLITKEIPIKPDLTKRRFPRFWFYVTILISVKTM